MTSQLNIRIDPEALGQIEETGGRLVIASSSMPSPGGQPTAWLAFRPVMSNTIQWREAYEIYTSTTGMMPGERIVPSATVPAAAGQTYTVASDGTITPSPGGVPGAIVIRNQNWQRITAGLYVTANVNGESMAGPATAAVIPSQIETPFFPLTAVTVVLQSYAQSGTVLNHPIEGLSVEVTGGAVNLVYDAATGRFEQQP